MFGRVLALTAASALALFAADAAAQVAEVSAAETEVEAEVDEVIVTARRREEAVGDVPFAVTVLGADDLAERRIDDTLTLFRQAPGLSLTTFYDGRFADFVILRRKLSRA